MKAVKIPSWFPKAGDVIGLVFGSKGAPERRCRVMTVAVNEYGVRAKLEGGGLIQFIGERGVQLPWGSLFLEALFPETRPIWEDDPEHTSMPSVIHRIVRYREESKILWPRPARAGGR